MVRINGRYLGNKRVELEHLDSGAKMITDAPKDNQGEGRSFSPTDLFSSSLGACMMTVMAIYAERKNIGVEGMRFELEKHMNASPRRVGRLPITLHLPSALAAEEREQLERVAHACPVYLSLHPDVQVDLVFAYDVE